MSPLRLALWEPWLCNTPHGHDRVPTFFWGPLTDQGSFEKKGWLLRYEILNISSLRNQRFTLLERP